MSNVDESVQVRLPRWKCHKSVYADKIVEVSDEAFVTGVGAYISLVDNDLGNRVRAGEKKPQVGDYYVVYDNGYASWSPAQPFEESYSRID